MQIEFENCFICLNRELARRENANRQLVSNCLELHETTRHVICIARQYDFKDIEANGFWTFISLVTKFGKLALNNDNEDDTLVHVSTVLLSGVALCRRFASRDPNDLFASPPEEFIELLEVFARLSPQLDVVYGSFCSYWLCDSMRRAMTGFTTLMAVYSCSPNFWKSSRNLWDKTSRAKTVAHIAQNASIEFVKSFWGLTETRILRHALPNLRQSPKINRELLIGRQSHYVISGKEAKVMTTSEESFLRQIRCRLLCSEYPKDSLSVVLHIHGGGFVSQSPDSHEIYLRDWSHRLPEAAILSVDYSLSPEEKYPTALQEVLDVYLWLKSDLATEVLQFKVKDIVVCGDSAGGNLALALTLALQQMPIESPKGVLCFYAPLMLQTRASPSRLMTAVDTLLPLGVLLSCLYAYSPTEEEDFEIIEEEDEDIPPVVTQWTPDWSVKVKHCLWSLKDRFVGSSNSMDPWYRKDNIIERLSCLNKVTNNAFISPLLSSELPKNIPLYLIGLKYDACLDDSIEMAKKWTEVGPVVLDVLDELPHGFLNFVMFSKEGKRASDLCLDRIKQSLI